MTSSPAGLSGLSVQILGYADQHETFRISDLQSTLRKPPQEIEAAVSQLRRLGYLRQTQPGMWQRDRIERPRVESEPDLHRIPAQLEHLEHRPAINNPTTSLIRPPAITRPAPKHREQETTMAKGRKCTKCEQTKDPRAFLTGDEQCRACRKGKPAATPKEKTVAKAPRATTKLRAIVRKHAASRKSNGAGIYLQREAVIQDLIARRDQITVVIEALQALG